MTPPITPRPLKAAHCPPAFPVHCLPQTIRDYVNFVSETTQVYPDMPASVALAALSVCLQGKAKVSFSPYWSEELNLYMLIIAPPGERKSAVFSAMTAPINKFVNEYNALHLIDVQTYFNSKKMLDSKLNKAIEKGEDSSVIRDIQMEINALQPVKEMKLITTDVTAEALAAIMSDNNDTMGIMSPEGGIFDVISGMYSNSIINLNIFLSSYDGEPVNLLIYLSFRHTFFRTPGHMLVYSLTIAVSSTILSEVITMVSVFNSCHYSSILS